MASLDLAAIAGTLEGLEETILYKLIDRAQFRRNPRAYAPGESGFAGETEASLFELRLLQQERMDAEFGRFEVPEERPFNRDLPASRRAVMLPDSTFAAIDFERVSRCAEIRGRYLALLPALCVEGDDGQYGSSVEHDVYALQAIARRVHYGALYVAESKFRDDPVGYSGLIAARDRDALLERLTRPEVETAILDRVRQKVELAQQTVNAALRRLIDPSTVVEFYREGVIPLTKAGEVEYLLQRLS